MNQLKIGICDDERIILEQLERILRKTLEDIETKAKLYIFNKGEELLSNIQELDVVFLDIEMPGLDGFVIGKKIQEINPECKIIMASSHVERFQEAFKIRAIRFVTKPFKQSEIEEVLEAILRIDIGKERIELYENRVSVQVEQRQIQYMISYDSYTEFVLKDRILRRNISLNELDEHLDSRIFYRIHRKMIVNMLFIQEYKNGRININKEVLQVARKKKKEFEKAFIECDLKYK